MPINLQGSGNIAEGWGPAPQLDAPALGPLVASILANKLARDKMTQENIAETIKNVREERQSAQYLEAMKAAGLVPEGYDAGGLGGAKLGTGLAKMIQDQNELAARERHQKAMEGFTGRRLDIAEADQGDDGATLDPAEQRRQDAERRREENDRLKAVKEQMKLAELPKDAVPHALAPGEKVAPGTYPFDVGGERKDIPRSQVDQFNVARRVYDALTKQRAGVPQRPPAETGDALPTSKPVATAEGYGNPVSDADVEALAWAKAHPDDPRSAAILKKLGL